MVGLRHMSPRGSALLSIGPAKEAETAFRDDLKKLPRNGCSLSALQVSLERQGRASEAAAVKAQIDRSWPME